MENTVNASAADFTVRAIAAEIAERVLVMEREHYRLLAWASSRYGAPFALFAIGAARGAAEELRRAASPRESAERRGNARDEAAAILSRWVAA